MVWLVGLLLPVVLLESLLVLTWLVGNLTQRLRMRGELATSSSVMLSVLCGVSLFLISFSPIPSQSHLVPLSASPVPSPQSSAFSMPAVVGDVETCPAQLLTELAETCYLQLVGWRTHCTGIVWRTLLADFFFLFLQRPSCCVAGLGGKTSLKLD